MYHTSTPTQLAKFHISSIFVSTRECGYKLEKCLQWMPEWTNKNENALYYISYCTLPAILKQHITYFVSVYYHCVPRLFPVRVLMEIFQFIWKLWTCYILVYKDILYLQIWTESICENKSCFLKRLSKKYGFCF